VARRFLKHIGRKVPGATAAVGWARRARERYHRLGLKLGRTNVERAALAEQLRIASCQRDEFLEQLRRLGSERDAFMQELKAITDWDGFRRQLVDLLSRSERLDRAFADHRAAQSAQLEEVVALQRTIGSRDVVHAALLERIACLEQSIAEHD